MAINDLIELRKQLFANGYQPIPNYDKQTFLKGWNDPDYSRLPDIAKFPRRFQATGLRVTNNLRVIDLDIDHPLIDQVFSAIDEIVPDVSNRAPARYGASQYKVALFCRAPEGDAAFSMLPVHKYLVDGKAHSIEIFGGGMARSGNIYKQVGAFGPHSHDPVTKKVAFQYAWDPERPSLLDTPLAELPELSKAQALDIAAAFERIAEAAGWERVARPVHDSAAAVYDITDLSRFDTDRAGPGLTYHELCDALAYHGELRCSASFMPDRGDSGDTSRCWVFHSPRHDCAAVFVYGDEQTHYPATEKPALETFIEEIGAVLPRAEPAARPDDKDGLEAQAAWLLQGYAYCATNDSVVDLNEPSDTCQFKMVAFQRLFRSWHRIEIGPRGGEKRLYATSGWELHPDRVNVRNVLMRPDMPFPTYQVENVIYKNTYRAPQHRGEGDIKPWLLFLAHLLPDERERNWFCDWLAHKYRNPGIPGVAVIMVAATDEGPVYGAGRGMLRDILGRLMGPQYVRTIDFDVFTGRSSQGVYTDWAAYSTLVVVNEAKDTPESGKWADRRAVYERIKELVDPAPVERMFTPKGRPAFVAWAFASYLIFSNNRDALQLPADDRRATALSNGGRLSPQQAEQVDAWTREPGNIAALGAWLEARDLTHFDAYAPLETETKATMQELARSDVDIAFSAIQKVIGPRGLFTGEMVLAAVLGELGGNAGEGQIASVKRMIKNAAKKVDGEFRLPLSQGKHWILSWRGFNTKHITETGVAQSSVEHSRKIIAKAAEDHGMTAVILDFTPLDKS